jgi:hypothetical protein
VFSSQIQRLAFTAKNICQWWSKYWRNFVEQRLLSFARFKIPPPPILIGTDLNFKKKARI